MDDNTTHFKREGGLQAVLTSSYKRLDQALMVNLNERNRMRNIKRKIYNTKYLLILQFFH